MPDTTLLSFDDLLPSGEDQKKRPVLSFDDLLPDSQATEEPQRQASGPQYEQFLQDNQGVPSQVQDIYDQSAGQQQTEFNPPPEDVARATKFVQSPIIPAKAFAPYWMAKLAEQQGYQKTAGALEGVSNMEAGLTSPQNAAMLTVAPEGKLAQTAIAAYFEAQALKDLPDQIKAIQAETDQREKARMIAEAVGGAGLPVAGMAHVALGHGGDVSESKIGDAPDQSQPEQPILLRSELQPTDIPDRLPIRSEPVQPEVPVRSESQRPQVTSVESSDAPELSLQGTKFQQQSTKSQERPIPSSEATPETPTPQGQSEATGQAKPIEQMSPKEFRAYKRQELEAMPESITGKGSERERVIRESVRQADLEHANYLRAATDKWSNHDAVSAEAYDQYFEQPPEDYVKQDGLYVHKTKAAFVPSTEWQEIPEGAVLPNGGEYRFDQATGKNYARWSEANLPEAQQAGSKPEQSRADPAQIPESDLKYAGEPTGINKAAIASQRESRGLDPIERQKQIDFGTSLDRANQLIADDPELPKRLVDELALNPRSLNPEETPVIIRRVQDTQAEFDRALKAVNEAPDEAATASGQARLANARDEYDKAVKAAQDATSRTGAGLNSVKMLVKDDYSLARMENRERAAQNGKPLSAEQSAKIEELHNRISELEQKVSNAEARKIPPPARRKFAFEDAANAARSRIIARRGRLNVGIDPAALADEAIIGAYHISRGVTKFADWSATMVKEFGERIRPYLMDLFARAKQIHKSNAQPTTESLSRQAAGESIPQRKAGQRMEAAKVGTYIKTRQIEEKLASGDLSKPAKAAPLQPDKELFGLRADLQRARNQFEQRVARQEFANQPALIRGMQHISGLARLSALSGYHTIGKLFSFSVGKLAERPLTEAVGGIIDRTPGMRRIAAKADLESGSRVSALANFYGKAATKGIREAYTELRTGSTSENVLHGKVYKQPRYWYDYVGTIHGAEKAVATTGAMEAYRTKAFAAAIRKGLDPNDPIVRGVINQKTFEYANWDKLQENNKFADMVNQGLQRLEARNPKTGRVEIEKAVLSNFIKTFVTKGIIKTPSNFLMQTLFQRSPVGLARGIGGAVSAHIRGIDMLKPEEANAIVKLLSVGAVGTAMTALGAIDATRDKKDRIFGGYYQPGDKRGPDDVPFGRIRIGGVNLPHVLTHNLLTEPAQIGNTIVRVASSLKSKKSGETRGALEGIVAAAMSPIGNAPIANPLIRAQLNQENHQSRKIVSDIVKGLIPQIVQNIAEDTDTTVQEPEYRKPQTFNQDVEMALPGLRQQVPLNQSSKHKTIKELLVAQ